MFDLQEPRSDAVLSDSLLLVDPQGKPKKLQLRCAWLVTNTIMAKNIAHLSAFPAHPEEARFGEGDASHLKVMR